MKVYLFLFIFIFTCACEKNHVAEQHATNTIVRESKEFLISGKTMGTSYHVKFVSFNKLQNTIFSNKLKDIEAAIEKELLRINQQMSTYIDQSELSRFNQVSKRNEAFKISKEFAEVMQLALRLSRQSSGAFDVTVGPLIKLWGFDKGAYQHRTKIPSKAEIAKLQAYVGSEHLHLSGLRLSKDHQKIYVNLSAVAKGYAVDRISNLLLESGINDHLVEIGGEVMARGLNKQKQLWTLGINTPSAQSASRDAIRVVALSNKALATSGNYRNFFEENGKRYGHILDPRSFAPVKHHLLSVSIIAENCALADALATTAMVLGEQQTRELLKRYYPKVEALFIYADVSSASNYRISSTANFVVQSLKN